MAVFQVTPAGIVAPSYEEILTELQAQMRAIYGNDIYLGNDSQDGQLLAIQARTIHDANAAAIAVYNSFSPATAQGNGLSSVVRINGIQRLVPSHSSVDVRIVGVAGTEIYQGIISDSIEDWNLPELVTIPPEGEIIVTATAQQPGAIEADPGTVNQIITLVRGWQTVSNPDAATPGAPVETDALLRRRQTVSTMLPSAAVLDGIKGGVANLDGVVEVAAYENDTHVTNADGIPAHSICLVVDGGDAMEIARTIYHKKTAGAYTYGDIEQNFTNSAGLPVTIRFFRPDLVDIQVEITIRPLPGYATSIGNGIRQAVADAVNALLIGDDVYHGRLYTPANLSGALSTQVSVVTGVAAPSVLSSTYEIQSIKLARMPGVLAPANVVINFDERAQIELADVNLVLV